MATPFKQGKDRLGNPVKAVPFSDEVRLRVLAANTGETQAIPSNSQFVAVTPTANLYLQSGAVAPSVPSVDQSGEQNIHIIGAGQTRMFSLDDETSLAFVAESNSKVSFEFYT